MSFRDEKSSNEENSLFIVSVTSALLVSVNLIMHYRISARLLT